VVRPEKKAGWPSFWSPTWWVRRDSWKPTKAMRLLPFTRLHDGLIATAALYGGRVFKTMGDGALFEFASPVAAVRCALEVQQALAERSPRSRKTGASAFAQASIWRRRRPPRR
jgi:hypothetical protein